MNDKLTVGSLFSGIGGLELGLERTGSFETRWQCEINEYARKVLAKNWPGLPIYQDVKELYETEFPERVDVLCGGFPCQPFSTAGKRRGEQDERFLWPEFIRIVRHVRPRWVIAENVPGLLTIDSGRVFGRILGDLASCGYDAEWDTISAASVGALHPRNRIFIVGRLRDADRTPGQLPLGRVPVGAADAWRNGNASNSDSSRRRKEQIGLGRSSHPTVLGNDGEKELVAVTKSEGSRGLSVRSRRTQQFEAHLIRSGQTLSYTEHPSSRCCDDRDEQTIRNAPEEEKSEIFRLQKQDVPDPSWRGAGRGDVWRRRFQTDAGPLELGRRIDRLGMFRDEVGQWWAVEPDVGRVADGVPSRVDRLRSLGNAVVPQCAEYIGNCILEWEGLM